jgi:hypothetical protein
MFRILHQPTPQAVLAPGVGLGAMFLLARVTVED